MKLIALAAAFSITGTAALAQDTPPPAPAAPAAQESAAPEPMEPAPAAPAPIEPAPAAAQTTDDPVGGYQPATPPLSGPAQPGQQVVFQQSKSPTEAYPAPAPLESYPICKKGQFDNCRQRGG